MPLYRYIPTSLVTQKRTCIVTMETGGCHVTGGTLKRRPQLFRR